MLVNILTNVSSPPSPKCARPVNANGGMKQGLSTLGVQILNPKRFVGVVVMDNAANLTKEGGGRFGMGEEDPCHLTDATSSRMPGYQVSGYPSTRTYCRWVPEYPMLEMAVIGRSGRVQGLNIKLADTHSGYPPGRILGNRVRRRLCGTALCRNSTEIAVPAGFSRLKNHLLKTILVQSDLQSIEEGPLCTFAQVLAFLQAV